MHIDVFGNPGLQLYENGMFLRREQTPRDIASPCIVAFVQ